jgi:hypothetical protein
MTGVAVRDLTIRGRSRWTRGRRHALPTRGANGGHAGSVVLAGTRHSPSKLSDQPLKLFEIYSPAGGRFGFVVDEG